MVGDAVWGAVFGCTIFGGTVVECAVIECTVVNGGGGIIGNTVIDQVATLEVQSL